MEAVSKIYLKLRCYLQLCSHRANMNQSRLAEQNASQSKFSSVVQLRSEFDRAHARSAIQHK